jgi:lipoyl(octanoyl) transferase
MSLVIRNLGLRDYQPVLQAMQDYNASRDESSSDEFWVVEHPPVFTQGLNSQPEHLKQPGDIPVIDVDRGGQVTYHGPGQIVIYLLVDIRRKRVGVRYLVDAIEQAIIKLLADYGFAAVARKEAPGVYVNDAKVAALGLRIRNGCSYHGLALNVDMDLEPFTRINPCGYEGLAVTQLKDLGIDEDRATITEKLISKLKQELGYSNELADMSEARL